LSTVVIATIISAMFNPAQAAQIWGLTGEELKEVQTSLEELA